jgi:choloylglycine hydrolase
MNLAKILSAAVAAVLMVQAASVEACTGIRLKAKDGSTVNGRTLEFGVQVETSSVVVPRGYEFVGTTPRGPGLKYKTKYAVSGAIAYSTMAVLDGLNEKGLCAGTFYFPGFAGYAQITDKNRAQALSPGEFCNWVLTQFATVDEVKAALNDVVIAPTVDKAWGTEAPPFHYVVYDKSGKSLVIEPIDGKLVSYENVLGTFTNSPTFDWHMTNLRNFINLTPSGVPPLKIDGLVLAPFGQGSGMVGLPGDFTPPSRFVRAAIYSIVATPSDTSESAVYQCFHILNQFDIPVGAVRTKVGDIGYTDYTSITSVKDPHTLKYYYRTYSDQQIHVVDLKKFNLDEKNIKIAKTATAQVPAVDVSADLK